MYINFLANATERAMQESDISKKSFFLLCWLSGEKGTVFLDLAANIVLFAASRNLSLASGQECGPSILYWAENMGPYQHA